MRWHSAKHRPLTFRGTSPSGEAMFEIHADDGRTYILRLNADDVAAVADRAGERALLDEAGGVD